MEDEDLIVSPITNFPSGRSNEPRQFCLAVARSLFPLPVLVVYLCTWGVYIEKICHNHHYSVGR